MANNSHGRQLNRESYVYGNTVRNIDVRTAIEGRPSHAPLYEIEGENRKSRRMNMSFAYVVFLLAASVALGFGLVSYLNLRSDITSTAKNIAIYEQELNNLTLANDDEYSKMINAIDFDEIRKIAIEELDMVYADESQIVSYSKENSDYVRQLNNLSN